MQFTVPQFIEKETPIVGSLTFKQFIYLAIAGGLCFFLYFTLAKTNFFLFLIISIIIIGVAFALAFLQIGGRPLPTILANAFKFSLSPKKYLWKPKETPVSVLNKEVKEEIRETRELPLKIAEKSQLKKIKASKGLY